MVNYLYRIGVRKRSPVPHTQGRYAVLLNDGDLIYDNLTGKIIEDQGEDSPVMLPDTVYGDQFTRAEIIALVKMPVHVPPDKLRMLTLDEIDGKRYWKFPEAGIESGMMPGFYHVPEFTKYVVTERGQVFSTITGEFLSSYLGNNGYRSMRVSHDDGSSIIMLQHILIAVTFHGQAGLLNAYTVDHIDGDRENNRAENLEWVKIGENLRRSRLHQYNKPSGRAVLLREIPDGEILKFPNARQVAQHLGVTGSSIFHHLNSANPDAVYKRKYLIWYEGDEGGEYTKAHMESVKASSYSRAVLAKDVATGIISRYASGAEFQRSTGISRKRVFSCLTDSKQVCYDGIIFKYEDDPSEWIA